MAIFTIAFGSSVSAGTDLARGVPITLLVASAFLTLGLNTLGRRI
jgi:hypothetical protein